MSGRPQNLSGQQFGRLHAVDLAKRSPAGRNRWRCICSCGQEALVSAANLRSGHTQSCGCLHREIIAKVKHIHGGSGTRLHRIWTGMLRRCLTPSQTVYASYGGRGIHVYAEWRHDFADFREWALANGYHDGLTIDRIDNDGDYEPGNCRWVTMKVQANNRRKRAVLAGRLREVDRR